MYLSLNCRLEVELSALVPADTGAWAAALGTAEAGPDYPSGGPALFEQFSPDMAAARFHQGLASSVEQLVARNDRYS
jgi:hypothetical protein